MSPQLLVRSWTYRGHGMSKKIQTRVGFWTWLLGGGWGNAGSGG